MVSKMKGSDRANLKRLGDALSREMAPIIHWVTEFASAVRSGDYARGRLLFDSNVIAFGTRIERMEGLDQLVTLQWRQIWDVTRDFSVDLDAMRGEVNENLAWIAAPWHSQGRRADGTWFDRAGRATFVLARRDGCWLAIHSHLSMNPQSDDRIADK